MRTCPECKKELIGRLDKKFCSSYCKSAHHNQLNKDKEGSMYTQVDKQLKHNRRILKQYNKAGKSTVRKSVLLEEGFNPKYFTHYWKNQKAEVYLFCYEFGFLEKNEHDRAKYVLVQWQEYMN